MISERRDGGEQSEIEVFFCRPSVSKCLRQLLIGVCTNITVIWAGEALVLG